MSTRDAAVRLPEHRESLRLHSVAGGEHDDVDAVADRAPGVVAAAPNDAVVPCALRAGLQNANRLAGHIVDRQRDAHVRCQLIAYRRRRVERIRVSAYENAAGRSDGGDR